MKKSLLSIAIITLLTSLNYTATSQTDDNIFKNFPRLRVVFETQIPYIFGTSDNERYDGGIAFNLGGGVNYRTGYNNMLSSTYLIRYKPEYTESNGLFNHSVNLVFSQVLKSTFDEDGSRSADIIGPGFQLGIQRNFGAEAYVGGQDEDDILGSNLDGIARFAYFQRGIFISLGYNFNISKLTTPSGDEINTSYISFGVQFPLFTILK